MNILHVVRQFYPNRGGLEDFVANLAREQIRNGCTVRVITCDRAFTRLDETLPKEETWDGIAIQRLPFRGSTRYPLAPSVLGYLKDADIVHVHAVDFFFDYLAWTKWLHRKPLVATTHGGFFHTSDHADLKRLWFNGPTRLSSRAYDAIVGCSDSDTATFAKIAPRTVRTIENGVDLSKFSGTAGETPLKSIVTVGRFSKNKRIDLLVGAVAELIRRDPEWRLHIAGIPSDLTASGIDRIVQDSGISNNVTVHVGLDDDGLREVFRQASFFLSASEYEGFGIALIEAMSAGLRCIVHPNASFQALAAEHPTLTLADFNDASATAAVIQNAWDGRASFAPPDLSRYDWSNVAARYQAVYEKVLA